MVWQPCPRLGELALDLRLEGIQRCALGSVINGNWNYDEGNPDNLVNYGIIITPVTNSSLE